MTKERGKIENLNWESSKNISTFYVHQFESLGHIYFSIALKCFYTSKFVLKLVLFGENWLS